MMQQIISPKTRSEFRNLATNSTLRQIKDAFTDEGFSEILEPNFEDSSKRRTTANNFLNSVNWSDLDECNRAIKAMERILGPIAPEVQPEQNMLIWNTFSGYLREDGWEITSKGKIFPIGGGNQLGLLSIADLKDPSAIEEQLERLHRFEGDPAAVIGASKELIEATAKVILKELGNPYRHNIKFNDLVKLAQSKLGLDPSNVRSIDSENSVKRILGGASSVALGLNELRNAGYGTGHGQATARVGIHARHARLALNAANLWCELILQTYSDPHAPWRNRH